MKKIFLRSCKMMLFLALLILVSCSKTSSSNNQLIGQWQWSYSVGGIAVQTVNPKGNIVFITFNQDSTYIYSENGVIQVKDKYHITDDSNYGLILQLANFKGSKLWLSPNGEIVTFKNEQFVWDDYMISDGYTHYFQRIK